MNLQRLKKQIVSSEGIRYEAYKDTLGHWTIGIGHLIKDDEKDLITREKPLTNAEVDVIFHRDLNQAIDDARKFIDENSIHEIAFEICVDMAFNLGLPKLSQFKRFKQALIDNNYILASQEMLDSRWAKQLPNRSKRLSDEMKGIAC
jgi:lysozyme